MEVQTDPISRRHAVVATETPVEAETQTDDADVAVADVHSLRFDGWQNAPPEVVAFLQRTGPLMESELELAASSTAIDSLVQLAMQSGDDDDDRGLLHSLGMRFRQTTDELSMGSSSSAAASSAKGQAAQQPIVALKLATDAAAAAAGANFINLPCTAVSWNATGSLVACSFGALNHEGWCTHKSGIAIWNVFKRPTAKADSSSSSGSDGFSFSASAGSTSVLSPGGNSNLSNWMVESSSGGGHHNHQQLRPELVLEWGTCITSCAFHPTVPYLLAAGTHNGEVLLFDISSNSKAGSGSSGAAGSVGGAGGMMIAKSRMDDYFHREGISSLRWVTEPIMRMTLLVSASAEGRVQVWSQFNQFSFPLQSFQITVKPKARASNLAGGDDDDRGGGSSDSKRAMGSGDDDDGEGPGGKGSRSGRTAAGVGGSSGAVPAGVTGLDFPLEGTSSAMFVAGTESGSVHRCVAQLNPQSMDSALAEHHVSSAQALGQRAGPRPAGSGSGGGPAYVKPGGIPGAETTQPWERAAVSVLTRLPPSERAAVARAMERYAREVNSPSVPLRLLYQARCEPRCLFPNPVVFDYSSHAGSVLSVACSPFNRSLFLTGGGDGKLCLFSALSQQPLLTFEPGLRSSSSSSSSAAAAASEAKAPDSSATSPAASSSLSSTGNIPAVLAASWSKARPCVIAAATSDGAVTVYDLYASTSSSRPAAMLRCSDGSYDGQRVNAAGGTAASAGGAASSSSSSVPVAATSLAFNPKQRRLIAVGDSLGRLHVWKLAWRLGNEQPQEAKALALFANKSGGGSGEGASSPTGAGGAGGGKAGGQEAAPVNSLAFFKSATTAAAAKR